MERYPLDHRREGLRRRVDIPCGSTDNRRAYEQGVRFADEISEAARMLLFDAQTSGAC